MRSTFRAAFVLVLIAIAMSLAAGPASAHETRNIGPYRVVVGWLGEPAFVGTQNAVDFHVTDTRTTPPRNVEGLEKTLTVEVFQGGSKTPFRPAFRTRFGMPGAYAADLIPTREGNYRFVIRGNIEMFDVNETFESGPGRFDEIRPVSALQYPDRVPTGADLSRALDDIRSTGEQVRIIAILALVLALASLAIPFVRRRT